MSINEKLLNLIYPRCCPVCHRIVVPYGEIVCASCVQTLHPIEQPRCMQCGKSLTDVTREYCEDCLKHPHVFCQGIGIYPYKDTMRKSVEKYKFQGRREYADFYVQAMIRYGADAILRWNPGCLVPIPLHPRKEKRRGFNQAELLARGLGRHFNLPVHQNALKRVSNAAEQKTLNARQRRRSQKHVFALGEDWKPEASVLLVDDVYTTGSTIDAAAAVLKQAGVQKIYFITLCQGKGF